MSRGTDTAAINHVLNRIAFGPRRRDWALAEGLGAEGYVRWQLETARIDDPEVESKLDRLASLTMDIGELMRDYPPPNLVQRSLRQDEELDEEARRRLARQSMIPLRELGTARMIRAIESRRQLNEVLVDFWFNHFNVFSGAGPARFLISTYERQAIRPHVLGSFRELLGAVARSPAMLSYLDNWRSAAEEGREVAGSPPRARDDAVEDAVRRMQRFGRRLSEQQKQRLERMQRQRNGNRPPGLNENYARELLELHTLGVDGGYTQADVREVARALTGWTMTFGSRTAEPPGFVFRADWHDAEEKTILGTEFPAGRGVEEGEAVLDMLAAHPSTATFIATKLCRKFIADEPPAAAVDTVAGAFLRTKGNLRATTAAVLLSEEFLGTGYRAAKVKSPLEFLASTARALELPINADGRVTDALRLLGAPLYGAIPPTGYPDTAEEWTSANAILARMDVGSTLAGVALSPARRGRGVEPGPTGTGEERTDTLLTQLLPGGAGDETRDRIVEWVVNQDETPSNSEIATLVLGSPEFQRR